jgi:hypothetical protein
VTIGAETMIGLRKPPEQRGACLVVPVLDVKHCHQRAGVSDQRRRASLSWLMASRSHSVETPDPVTAPIPRGAFRMPREAGSGRAQHPAGACSHVKAVGARAIDTGAAPAAVFDLAAKRIG